MKKVLGIATAVFMLAGGLVGCGNNQSAEEPETTTSAASIETQAETVETAETTTRANSKDGWGSITSRVGADTGNFTKLRCGMSLTELADLGYGSKEQSAKFSGNPEAQSMDHILHFYTDGVTSFDYAGTPVEMGTDPESKQPYSAYVDISVNGDTGELYAARYIIGVSEEDADTAAALADALFEQYDNGSGEQTSEHGYLIPDCEAFNGSLIIYYGSNTDKTQNAFIFRIYNEDYNNAPDFYQNGNLKKSN